MASEESFAGRLAAAHPDTEVINLGVTGFGTDQELLILREELPRIDPRVATLTPRIAARPPRARAPSPGVRR